MNFIENVEKSRFNQFVASHPKGHVLQSSEWGEFKSLHEWKMHRVGLEEKGELKACALLLSRSLPLVKKPILYAPRGFVIDFYDRPLLEAFTREIKKMAKKMGAVFVKIDPDVKRMDRDPEGNAIPGGENHEDLIGTMGELGYRHKGFALDFDGIQPRFCFRLDITPPEEEIFKHFHPKTRYNIRLAERKGIEIIEGKREDLVRFTEIMKVTGERDGFITRPLRYFQEMYDTLVPGGMMKLFLARYNSDQALTEMEEERERLLKDRGRLEKKKERLDEGEGEREISSQLLSLEEKLKELEEKKRNLLQERNAHPEGIIVSGAILLIFGDKAWYLYGASDNIYRNLMPNALIQWEMIRWSKRNGAKLYDFRGISGDLSPENPLYGLYRFKKGFGGEFTEFLGEFDLIIHKPLYYAWEVLLPRFRKARRSLRKLLKRT
ncbi:lipid II:glycine glycyltransferase FemX [Thermicanus aegyptius]|uniref:lipid II:glycine glycyltransferase FemX n=1 Tax=Thermicanus aegyptius TaxID=94009 RepID=UPI0003F6E1D1|nr:lipid II:glycine glycyltransferase FemX [Thermicanus aegyptius]